MQNLPTTDEVRELIATTLGVAPELVTETADLLADLDADSLVLAQLVAVFEERFQTRIPPEQFAYVETVGEMYTALCEVLTVSNTSQP